MVSTGRGFLSRLVGRVSSLLHPLSGLLGRVSSFLHPKGRGGPELDKGAFQELSKELAKAERVARRQGAEAGLRAAARAFRREVCEAVGVCYEFTYEELAWRLEKKRANRGMKQALSSVSQKLIELEYSGREATKAEVLSLINEMKRVAQTVSGKI